MMAASSCLGIYAGMMAVVLTPKAVALVALGRHGDCAGTKAAALAELSCHGICAGTDTKAAVLAALNHLSMKALVEVGMKTVVLYQD